MIKNVRVSLGSRSYDVKIGENLIEKLGALLKGAPSRRAFIVADEKLGEHRKRVLAAMSNAGWEAHELAVTAGESLKDMKNLFAVYGQMLEARIDRSSTLIALGGGSVGDAAGFVASTYLRGIRWVGLPTTLLAQVDSSVGGKTAVNLPEGKNLVGTFHQPSLVVCETSFLKTLNDREILSGLGEITKCALTFDPKFYARVQKKWTKLRELDEKVLSEMIYLSLKYKAKAVSRDELDLTGTREVLNFGHTFGHALESVTGYGYFQHGEAVLWGMRFAIALSLIRKKLSRQKWQEIDTFLRMIPVPVLPSRIDFKVYQKAMSKDKKAFESKIRFVLLKTLGETVSDRNVTSENLKADFELMSSNKKG